jgi:alkanesulfonate monooxygenase SsuD/methylene tetrahydromethanopterin reductase-like flavin-dependent oxidoreductase (luciferase family)
MCPNVAQFLTYMAGRTRKVKLGSMVMVLPWHDLVRLAEEVSVLDHLSGGRVIPDRRARPHRVQRLPPQHG